MSKLVRINIINTTYVEKYILFIVGIIENNKSLIIIQQLNDTIHRHCCILQAHVSDTHRDHTKFCCAQNKFNVSGADQNGCLRPSICLQFVGAL
jgi:hypothetical protein